MVDAIDVENKYALKRKQARSVEQVTGNPPVGWRRVGQGPPARAAAGAPPAPGPPEGGEGRN
eukprot:2442567-Pyramimonas_sp.AAC.1